MKFSGPKLLLHTEGLVALLMACIYYHHSDGSWGIFAALFLTPDLSMLGYVFGNSIGASTYDAFHTYTAPFLLWAALYLADKASLSWICAIWIAHIGFDRLLGYGLKYSSGFKDTHLDRV
jgi:hypothetical protein